LPLAINNQFVETCDSLKMPQNTCTKVVVSLSHAVQRLLHTRAVWKFRGLTLLFRVGTLWRCDNGLFFEMPPLASDALLTTLHSILENVLQTVDHFVISCLGAPFSWLGKPGNRMGRDLDCVARVLMGFQRSTFSKPNTKFNSDLAPCDFWAFQP
jgi:hypothetical protein